MPLNLLHSVKNFLTAILFFALAASGLHAQSNPVCEEGDCPADIFSVQLDESLQGQITPKRTEQFKTAYLQVKEIKTTFAQHDPTWESRYNANALGGRNCVRLNQMESHFAFEYERNPDFASFIDQNEPDIQAFKENGFESSRRALNLKNRMDRHCPQEIKKVEKEKGPSLEDLPDVFMKLGQVLGYFDEEGNMIKPLKNFSEAGPDADEVNEIDFSTLSKGKKVNYLKDKVNQLPIGQEKQDQISGLTEGLKAARPSQDQLDKSLKDLEPRFAALLPRAPGLQGKLETNRETLRNLQAFKPKNPKRDLSPKINKLFETEKNLNGKTEALYTEAKALKTRYDQITTDFAAFGSEADQRMVAVEKMQSDLDNLEARKADLTAKLEDKPKKILDELTQQVTDIEKEVEDLSKKIESESKEKEALSKKLDELIASEKETAGQLGQLEKEIGQLTRDQAELEDEIKKLEWEAEDIKKEEAQVEGLKEKLASLKSEDALGERILICEEALKSRREKVKDIEEAQKKQEKEAAELSKIPARVGDKLTDLKLFLNKLKLGYDDIPVTDRSMGKIEQLLEKASIISSSAEILTDKQNRLQQQVGDFDQNLEKTSTLYASMLTQLDELRKELKAMGAERSGLQRKLEQGIEDVNQTDALVNDFLERYSAFEGKTKCKEEELIETLQKEQAEIEQKLKDLGVEMNEIAGYEEKLAQETEAVDQEVQENTQLTKQLKQEEETLKEEFKDIVGQDLSLQAVPMEEWKEATQVERPYWEASVHPDNELVHGYKGKYFEISLKDAEKNAKVLFNPGKYSLDKMVFRNNYGATLGSFVNEALLYLKKSDEGQVKVFIQGSADITGQNTFRGKLEPDYLYEEITLLPLDEDREHFHREPLRLKIPANGFLNEDLPNLRARYLKEIIGAYTTKLDPIVLEGIVKEFEGKEERNAAIYLFFPEELLARY
ncbi:MAG: hypothetical protein IPL49_19760 [Saprospirales bacterium]|nr:hypothetical protein [Saprospirales bacterium]